LSEFLGPSPAVGESAEGDGEREGEGAERAEEREERAHPHGSNGMKDSG